MDQTDLEAISGALAQHKWLPLAVAVIGVLARLAKDDTRFPWVNVPARWQPVLVVALSTLYAGAEAALQGAPWRDAVGNAVLYAVFTMSAFDVVVKAVLNGKDLPAFASGLLKPASTDNAGK